MTVPMSSPPTAPAEQIAQAFAAITATPEGAAPTTPPAPVPGTPGAPGVPGVAPEQQPAQEFTPEYVARLRDEAAQHRVRAAMLEGISPADINALAPLLEALRTGDVDTVDQWAAGLYESRGLANANSTPQQQQAAANVQQATAEAAQSGTPLTPEQVREMFREELRSVEQGWRQEQARLDAQARIEAQFTELGIDPNSEIARSVARVGQQLSQQQGRFVAPAEAFEAWKQMMAPVLGAPQAPAGQAQPGFVQPPAPPIAPSGIPATTPDTRSPEERGLARLMAARQG